MLAKWSLNNKCTIENNIIQKMLQEDYFVQKSISIGAARKEAKSFRLSNMEQETTQKLFSAAESLKYLKILS